MIAARSPTETPLIAHLPPVRGRLVADAPIGRQSWFGVGGPAEVLFRPADEDDLAAFLAALGPDVPVTVIGSGANLLIRDGGVAGVVIRLGGDFAGIIADREELRAGAGALDLRVARAAAEAGIAGLEFLSGIPGTIGGGLRMNAGAYGSEFKDVVIAATALDRAGRRQVLDNPAIGFRYRDCAVDPEWIFVETRLGGRAGAPAAIAQRTAEIRATREASQPIRTRTGGSTFANPPGDKAWRLIDAAGCRGLRRGGAQVSPKHTNFLVNTGTATAADLEGLGEEVRRRVFETSGVCLSWEIRRIGRPLPGLEPVAEEAPR